MKIRSVNEKIRKIGFCYYFVIIYAFCCLRKQHVHTLNNLPNARLTAFFRRRLGATSKTVSMLLTAVGKHSIDTSSWTWWLIDDIDFSNSTALKVETDLFRPILFSTNSSYNSSWTFFIFARESSRSLIT